METKLTFLFPYYLLWFCNIIIIDLYKRTAEILTSLLHFHSEKCIFTFMHLAGVFWDETIHKQTDMFYVFIYFPFNE